MNPVWAQHHGQYERSIQHLRIQTGVVDNLHLPPDQRDKRFRGTCSAYDVAFGDHLPSAYDVINGFVRDPLVHESRDVVHFLALSRRTLQSNSKPSGPQAGINSFFI